MTNNANPDKIYLSRFVPEHKIDLSNYLTEQIIANYLTWQKIPFPNCPFWRKDYVNTNDNYKELAKRYNLELLGVKELLKVFEIEAISSFIVKNKKIGFKFLTKEKQANFLYDLFKWQIKLEKNTPVENTIETVVITDKSEIKSFKVNKLKI